MNVGTAGKYLPITHDTFRRKYGVKAVSSKVQMPPLLRQRLQLSGLTAVFKQAFKFSRKNKKFLYSVHDKGLQLNECRVSITHIFF